MKSIPKDTDEAFSDRALQLVEVFSGVLPPMYEVTKWVMKNGERWYVTAGREK